MNDWDRVLAVTGSRGPGSGYLIGPALVLTSGHLVAPSGSAVTVFRPGRPGTFTGTVLWCGTPGGRDDAALVRIDDRMWTPVDGQVPWGRTVTHRPGLAATCWGVPDLVQRPDQPVDVAQLSGRLNPGDRMVTDRYVLILDGHPPAGPAPWAGLSGAAVFCGDLLTGVVAVDPAGRQHAALEAVPVSVLMRDPAFRAHVRGRCVGVELRELDDPHARPVDTGTGTSPAGLLAARNAVAPFLGRHDQLTELHAWAARPGSGLLLLHGPGGQGKTRLAHEFGNQLADEDWEVVWLRATADQPVALADAVVPVMAVVDYAESRVEQIRSLLDHPYRQPVKVLLLARTAGEWWQQLADANDLADQAPVCQLPALEPTDLYESAVTAYAAALGDDWTAAATRLTATPRPSADGDTVLAVHMTALADLLDSTVDGPVGSVRGPEDRLLDHERRHWRATARAHGLLPGLSMATLTDAIAATCLLGPPDVHDVDAFLARVPGLADQSFDRRDTVRAWLAALFPTGEEGAAFGALQPDRVAERLVGRLMLDRGRTCVVEVLAPEMTYNEALTLLTVCTRAAAHPALGKEAGDRLTHWCVEHATTLGPPAAQVATLVDSPDPLVVALDRLVRDGLLAEEGLRQLGNALPKRTEALAEVALTAARALVPFYREAAEQDPENNAVGLAMALCELSERLHDTGEHTEALVAVTEGVELLRDASSRDPDRVRPDLADGLQRLAAWLSYAGQPAEALAAATEATQLTRELAAAAPDEHELFLARNLDLLSGRLFTLRRVDESMAPLEEAVDIFRRHEAASPGSCLISLAGALHNLANRYISLSQGEAAITTLTESLEIQRALVEYSADGYLPNLASSLTALSVALRQTDRHHEALAAATEAVQILRGLAAARPGRRSNDLAISLQQLSACLRYVGRADEALAAITEAVEIQRHLVIAMPLAYLADFAAGLDTRSTQLHLMGRTEEALVPIVECLRVRFLFALAQPEASGTDLTDSGQFYLQIMTDLGRREQAQSLLAELADWGTQWAKNLPHRNIDEVLEIFARHERHAPT